MCVLNVDSVKYREHILEPTAVDLERRTSVAKVWGLLFWQPEQFAVKFLSSGQIRK